MAGGFGIFDGVGIELQSGLDGVRKRIAMAAAISGRTAGDVKLVAVSKTHPSEVIRDAITAGVTAFGG